MNAARTGPATYGQRSVLRSLEAYGPAGQPVANLTSVWAVPRGTRASVIVDAWLHLVEVHESLRTVYHQAGRLITQIVHGIHQPSVPKVELAEDTAAAAVRLAAESAAEPLTVTTNFPWRACLAQYRGVPRYLVTVIHHVAADRGALQILQAQFDQLLRGDPLPPAAQPLDLADHQLSNTAAAERTIQHWTESWAGLELKDRDPHDHSERRRASVYSVPALAAARELTNRLGVSVQSVVLGVCALALGRLEGRERVTFALMAANRLEEPWSRLVSSLNQYAPVTVTAAAAAHPAEFLRDTYMRSLTAYLNGSYDVDLLYQSLLGAGYPELDPTGFAKHFNFLGGMDSEPAPESLLRTGIEWRGSTQRTGPNFHLPVVTGEGLLLGVGASHDYLGRNLPAVLAASIEAGLLDMSASSPDSLGKVRLDPVRKI
jgi:hypothetical protein